MKRKTKLKIGAIAILFIAWLSVSYFAEDIPLLGDAIEIYNAVEKENPDYEIKVNTSTSGTIRITAVHKIFELMPEEQREKKALEIAGAVRQSPKVMDSFHRVLVHLNSGNKYLALIEGKPTHFSYEYNVSDL